MKNRFNRLSSKEWLPFQKSWFKYSTTSDLLRENIRFFTKREESDAVVLYEGDDFAAAKKICDENDIAIKTLSDDFEGPVQFAIIDLRNKLSENTGLAEYQKLKREVVETAEKIFKRMEDRRFIAIFARNIQAEEKFNPFAWDLAKGISTIFSIKDEKIGCITDLDAIGEKGYFSPQRDVFYCFYFRKDELSGGVFKKTQYRFFERNLQQGRQKVKQFQNAIPSWFVLKPQPRKRDEILHPAKYPEDLVEMFLTEFSEDGDNIFDPMSGTGSTQLGALKLNRNGYGTELSDFFSDIAENRCQNYLEPVQGQLFSEKKDLKFKIFSKDARQITREDFPEIDYLITSPPYWDMLNMKGAENQAKRIEKGLQTNYSDNENDLGNISDYESFISELVAIYFNVIELLKPGSYLTIVVKNIKKKGRNYPFAWDLANALQEKLILLPEVFWCQDDISIAPYGYGNTWVSNTFHQYCLNFQKPG